MRRMKKHLGMICLMASLMVGGSVAAFGYGYNLNIPYPLPNSMQSTKIFTKTAATTPYVQPNKNTISTNYFLSPQTKSALSATNIIARDSAIKGNFTWNAGYGGIGNSYCLSAYPNVAGKYDAYNVSGTWSN